MNLVTRLLLPSIAASRVQELSLAPHYWCIASCLRLPNLYEEANCELLPFFTFTPLLRNDQHLRDMISVIGRDWYFV